MPKRSLPPKVRRATSRSVYPVHANDASLVRPLLRLHGALSIESLWEACIELVDAALPNFHLIAALPFEGMAPMAIRTTLPEPDIEAFWLRVNAAEPPMARTLMEHPGLTLSTLDDDLSAEEIEGSRFYREIMQPGGWRHSAGLFFWDEGRFLAHLGIVRTREQGRFSAADKALLAELHPHFDIAMKRVAVMERHRLVSGIMQEALEHPLDGLALLDSHGALVMHNSSAAHACALWSGGREAAARRIAPGAALSLPVTLQDAAQSLRMSFLQAHSRERVVGREFVEEVAHPSQAGLVALLRVVVPANEAVPPHIRIEFSRLPAPLEADAAAPVFRLSEAEQRVAELVARGLRNEEVATELGISVNTVRAHLRETFAKLGVTHRGQLRGRLLPS
ncbi:MAG: hypothetical protein JNJ83_06225 [Verrucomicrobiaceae bacterium]|nr:hypothetical protein [Verrucomicrobiaceae bacterium]